MWTRTRSQVLVGRDEPGSQVLDAVASDDLSLSGGAVYTAVAVGYLTPENELAATAFDLVVAQDA